MTSKKKFLTLAVAGCCLIGAIFGFTACKNNATSSSSNEKGTVDDTLICGFNDYKELTSLRWLNSFGAVELTTEYKTEGDNAAKLTVRGHHENPSKPQVIIPTDTDYVPRTDYTDVESILVDVYNANEIDQKIGFQYLTQSEETQILSAEIIEVIPAKTHQTIEFKVDRNVTAQFLHLDLISSLRLTFENQKSYYEPNRIFYVDNMRIKTTNEPIDTSVKVRQDGEYESCDKPEYLSVWKNLLAKIYSNATLSFNDNPEYIKGGTGSFKLTSNYKGGSETAKRSVGFRLIKSEYTDISEYYSLSFWIYNANEVSRNFFMNNEFVQSLPAKEWTHIELTTDWIKSHGLDVKNFFPAFTFHAGEDKSYTWYIDEICLNKVAVNLVAPTLNPIDDTTNKTLLLQWENKGAAGYSYKVLIDGEEKVTETQLGVTTSVEIPYGSYTGSKMMEVLITSYGNGDAKKTASYKKAFFDFTSVPENFTMKAGETKTLPLATAEEGAITWKVEDVRAITTGYSKFQVVSTIENPSEITFGDSAERLLKITWTLTVDEYSIERYTFVLPELDKTALLTSEYEDFFTETEGKYSGDVKKSDYEIINGQPTIRVHNGTKYAEGTFVNNVYLGDHLSMYDYYLYNASDSAVEVKITSSDNAFTIPAKSMVRMNFVYWVKQGVADWDDWKVVKSDGTLNDMIIKATSVENAPVDIYIGYFRVNDNAFEYGPIYPNGTIDGNKAVVQWAVVNNTKNYSYQVKINGEDVIQTTTLGKDREVIFDYTQYLDDIIELEIIITATSNDGESVSATWKKKFLAFTSLPESMYVEVGQKHSIPIATTDKGTVTWKAEYIDMRYARGNWTNYVGDYIFNTVESPTTITLADKYRLARITWTLSYGDYSIQEYTYYMPNQGNNGEEMIALDEYYPTYLTSGTTSGDLAKTEVEIIADTNWLHLFNGSATASGNYSFTESVFLGKNRADLDFYIYNASDEIVTVQMYGGVLKRKIGAKTMVQVNLLAVASWELCVEGWGVVSKDGNINNFSISATSENGAVNVYLGAFRVNKSTATLGDLTLTGTRSNQTLNVSWDAVTGATKYAYRVIMDGVEIVSLTEIDDVCRVAFDYSGLIVNHYLEIEVTAYNFLGQSKKVSYRCSFYSGTY